MDLLVTSVVTGRATGLARTVRRALTALRDAKIDYCVIGATALAVRGLPRMTRDLDVVVLVDDAGVAISALREAGLRPTTPVGTTDDPEPMIVFVDPRTKVEVDLRVAAGDPEATAIEDASRASVFGVRAPVALLEHLLLLYLYSNQPKHNRRPRSDRAGRHGGSRTSRATPCDHAPRDAAHVARSRAGIHSRRAAPPKGGAVRSSARRARAAAAASSAAASRATEQAAPLALRIRSRGPSPRSTSAWC